MFSSSLLRMLLIADGSNALNKYYHGCSTALIVATPIAVFFSPSIISAPMDYILGKLCL